MALNREQSRRMAQMNAVARMALGVVAMALPQLPLKPWVGEKGIDRTSRLLARALGGRDLAIGLGTLLAMRHDAPVRGWVEAGGLADAGDTVITLASFSRLPAAGRWMVLAAAGSGVLSARLAAPAVDS
jgi:hypothetical protein